MKEWSWVFLLFLMVIGGGQAGAQGVPPDRLALLAKGINLNSWFTRTAPLPDSTWAFHADEAAFLKRAGFTVVRLPLAPDLLFDPDHPGVPGPALAIVDQGVRRLLDAGLAVIFDPIHSFSLQADWERRLAHEPGFVKKVAVYWEALARHFAAVSPDRIVFEVMNEPHLTAQESIDPRWWTPVQGELAAAIRRGAPENTILATGERWGGIEGLDVLEPLPDPNVVYSFHWYNPFAFTHQGASWTGPVQASLAGVPYPSSPEAVADLATLTDAHARDTVVRYGAERWNLEKVRAGLARAAEWGQSHHVPVFCGEFGAYRAASHPQDRVRWLTDVRQSLESLGIGWSMWDYDTDFGLVTWKEPRWHRGPVVDDTYLAALGLDPRATLPPRPGETLVADFEGGATDRVEFPVDTWTQLWTRDPGVGTSTVNPDPGPAWRSVVHTGARDWSLASGFHLNVRPGEALTVSSEASFAGSGKESLELVARDASGQVLDWSFATVGLSPGARGPVSTSFLVPRGVATVEPRFSGVGPSTSEVGAIRVVRTGQTKATAQEAQIENPVLLVRCQADATLTFLDRRSGTSWKTLTPPRGWAVLSVTSGSLSFKAVLLDPHTGRPITVQASLDPALPEVKITVAGAGSLEDALAYPPALAPTPGTRVVVPLNEGIWYPVEDPSAPQTRLVGYGGHGLSMDFWAVVGSPTGPGSPAFLGMIETPDDAALDLRRVQGLLTAGPVWEPQKAQFGYPRTLRYVFFDQAKLVDVTNRYRQAVRDRGDLVTLEQKRSVNPNVDRLLGAADVWSWDSDPVAVATALQKAGMDRVLWSVAEKPEVIQKLNDLGFLTGRYDLYQDVMDPGQFSKLSGIQQEWTSEAWPDGLVLDRSGAWVRGWEVEAKDGSRIPCGVLSDAQALPLAQRRLDLDLATHPYRARFIDTTTASAWREDWSPAHPLTRTQSREWRMKLLDLMAQDHRLVTGSETGQEAAVPHLHYFEGMMSLAPYRIPESGRRMQTILDVAPQVITQFQVNEAYRIPLWELVYHDCVVSYWYWGDYSNKIPAVWGQRDRFNALYGTPPVYMFDRAFWKDHRDEFAASYKTASTTARATATSAMTNFEVLTADASVQRTTFANGVQVTVNFGSESRTVEGVELPPGVRWTNLPPPSKLGL